MSKRSIIIVSIGVTLALLFAGFAGYMFFTNKKASDIFTGFGSGNNVPVSPTGEERPQPTIDLDPGVKRLVELTTVPVAGAVFIERDGAEYIRYAERGTGHLYEISLSEMKTSKVSGTTFTRTTSATWSETGNRVAITYEEDGVETTHVGALDKNDDGSDVVTGFSLPLGSRHISFQGIGDSVTYGLSSNTGTRGYSHNIKTGTVQPTYDIPLHDVEISTTESDIYALEKPSRQLAGYFYRVYPTFERIVGGGAALMAEAFDTTRTLVTTLGQNGVASYFEVGTSTVTLGLPALPEKCDLRPDDFLVCATPTDTYPTRFPESWYQGADVFEDTFWILDALTGNPTFIVSPAEFGVSLDAIDLTLNKEGTRAFFIDKNTKKLWLLVIE